MSKAPEAGKERAVSLVCSINIHFEHLQYAKQWWRYRDTVSKTDLDSAPGNMLGKCSERRGCSGSNGKQSLKCRVGTDCGEFEPCPGM